MKPLSGGALWEEQVEVSSSWQHGAADQDSPAGQNQSVPLPAPWLTPKAGPHVAWPNIQMLSARQRKKVFRMKQLVPKLQSLCIGGMKTTVTGRSQKWGKRNRNGNAILCSFPKPRLPLPISLQREDKGCNLPNPERARVALLLTSRVTGHRKHVAPPSLHTQNCRREVAAGYCLCERCRVARSSPSASESTLPLSLLGSWEPSALPRFSGLPRFWEHAGEVDCSGSGKDTCANKMCSGYCHWSVCVYARMRTHVHGSIGVRVHARACVCVYAMWTLRNWRHPVSYGTLSLKGEF